MSAADGGPVAILTALPEESRAILRRMTGVRGVGQGKEAGERWQGRLGGREVLLAETGAGARAAGEAAAEIFERRRPARWIGAGFAGALSPELAFGCIAIAAASDREMARRALACDPDARETAVVPSVQIVRTAAEKARLLSASRRGGTLPAIVDMESAAWSSAAAARGIPGILVRVVSDTASEEIPDFVAESVLPGGGIDRGRIVRHALLHPSSIGKLLDLRRRAQTCGERLAGFLDRFAAGGF
jgi:nucleoside phosphorylase